MCFLSKGTSGGTFLRSWLRLSFPSCRKASYLLGKHHGLDANRPKSMIIRSKHVKTSIFIGFLSLTVPFNQSTRFVWVLDTPAASPATSSKLWPWRAWCPRWHPGPDDPWTGLTPGSRSADFSLCRKHQASDFTYGVCEPWFRLGKTGSGWGFSGVLGQTWIHTMAKSKRIEWLTAWFLGQAWSQAVASESQQLLAGSKVLNCQSYQTMACFPIGYWIT